MHNDYKRNTIKIKIKNSALFTGQQSSLMLDVYVPEMAGNDYKLN